MAIIVRRAAERGHGDHGWLDTWHTFSFSDYHDPRFMGFRVLRVINEDTVAPGGGFPTHGHSDMEILSYVLDGALEHKDSIGTGSVIRPGDVQRMSAGTGVRHSEFNPSDKEKVHFLQIWLLPEREGIAPSYEQKRFPASEKQGKLRLIVAPDGRDGAVTIHQDAEIYASLLQEGDAVTHALKAGRKSWVQVVRGSLDVNGQWLRAGDGAAIADVAMVTLAAHDNDTEVLLFDLP